jgi:tRNA (mo5U34)-methyltransferase
MACKRAGVHQSRMPSPARRPTSAATAAEIAALGPWFHNLDLDGVQTAPDHFLGDYPRQFFSVFAHALPEDLRGWRVLDIGCNAGFFSFEMWRRGASSVLGVDADPRYVAQARYAARVLGAPVEFAQRSVFDLASLGQRFDLVLFTGVLYHLRHPLLALDLLRQQVVGRLLLFQTMTRGDAQIAPVAADYPFTRRDVFVEPGFPRMQFIEHRYAGDPTNWWVPNQACTEAMLRSAGFRIVAHPDTEVYLCEPDEHADLPDLPGPFVRTS